MSHAKRVAAIHDLSGYGKASLTVVIPTLSAMGIEVCPLPTALLSTHTGIPGFTFLDLTAEMRKIIAHWKSLNLSFDAIYSGFLGSPEQIEIVSNFIDEFRTKDTLVLVDPVLGDDGALYSTMNQEMVGKMRELVKKADIVKPNLTEAALLTGRNLDSFKTLWDFEICAREISQLGPRVVAITGMPPAEFNKGTIVVFDKLKDAARFVMYTQLPGHFSGTGDAFASIFLGLMLAGYDAPISATHAAKFVEKAIKITWENNCKELLLEQALYKL